MQPLTSRTTRFEVRHSALAWVFCWVMGLNLQAMGRAEDPPAAAKTPSDWRQTLKELGWRREAIEQLGRNKLLVVDEGLKQSFEPYSPSWYKLGEHRKPLAVFITSDSILNAYHVLYEQSVLNVEAANIGLLTELLQHIDRAVAGLQVDGWKQPALARRAQGRAQRVIGVAVTLLDAKTATTDQQALSDVEVEASRVRASQGLRLPAWLGPSSDQFKALDYSRFKPRGPYEGSAALGRYFRAMSWLKAIPFRVQQDEELLAALLLARTIRPEQFADKQQAKRLNQFIEGFADFVGEKDDWDLVEVNRRLDSARADLSDGLAEQRRQLLASINVEHDGPKVSDVIGFLPDDPTKVQEPQFRILSGLRMPDAVLFQRTGDPRRFRRMPDGLEVAAALGSAWAKDRLRTQAPPEVLAIIDQTRPLFTGSSLYQEWLKCLSTLVAPPDPRAPPLFGQEPWKIKSHQTVLASWAEQRHNWVLYGKETILTTGVGPRVPTAFVEPNPEFFGRLARLATHTKTRLTDMGVFAKDSRASTLNAAGQVTAVADLLAKGGPATLKELRTPAAEKWWNVKDEKRQSALREADAFQAHVEWVLRIADAQNDMPWPQRIERLRALAAHLEKGKIPDSAARFVWSSAPGAEDSAKLWPSLESTCKELQSLAQKQLRGESWTEAEEAFLRQYGHTIAEIMGYRASAVNTPKDTTPKIVSVAADPWGGRGYLQVGIGRPRILYVLYPYQGRDVLCAGSVLPYYEFTDRQRLTDAEWKQRLDSPTPAQPKEWTRPLTAGGS